MAKITIDDLSLDELRGLCYNNFNAWMKHPCFCVICGKGYKEAMEFEEIDTNPPGLMYCCDNCTHLLEE